VTATTRQSAGSAAHRSEEPIGELVADVSRSLSTLLHSEIELAKLELKVSVKNAGVGVGFFGAALVLLVFSLTFGLIALAEGIAALGVYRWLSYLIVFLLLLAIVGACVFLGIKKVKKVKAPERTIATSKDTVAYLKANTKRG
jgi:Putative Actinobacterial Holin-X, holin superfamily III